MKSVKKPWILRFESKNNAISISLSHGEKKKIARVKEKDALLAAVNKVCVLLPKKQHPDHIVVCGDVERFSESRSIVTIANTLAFAWKISISIDENSKKDLWPLKPMYSSEPHITNSKK